MFLTIHHFYLTKYTNMHKVQGWHEITHPGLPSPLNPGLPGLGFKVIILPTLGFLKLW